MQDPDATELGSSTICLFLTLAWLDNAFKHITSLYQLFHIKLPESRHGIRLEYRDAIRLQPILRKESAYHQISTVASDNSTSAWSSAAALNQIQRLCLRGGWPQRMTFYNIRRGVLNKLDGITTLSTLLND